MTKSKFNPFKGAIAFYASFFPKTFKEDHLYGQLLNFLYENINSEFADDAIVEEFNGVERITVLVELGRLEADELIVVTKTTPLPANLGGLVTTITKCRLSHKGYTFVSELKHRNKSNVVAVVAVVVALFSMLYTLAVGMMTLEETKKANQLDAERFKLETKKPDTVFQKTIVHDTLIVHDTIFVSKKTKPASKKKAIKQN